MDITAKDALEHPGYYRSYTTAARFALKSQWRECVPDYYADYNDPLLVYCQRKQDKPKFTEAVAKDLKGEIYGKGYAAQSMKKKVPKEKHDVIKPIVAPIYRNKSTLSYHGSTNLNTRPVSALSTAYSNNSYGKRSSSGYDSRRTSDFGSCTSVYAEDVHHIIQPTRSTTYDPGHLPPSTHQMVHPTMSTTYHNPPSTHQMVQPTKSTTYDPGHLPPWTHTRGPTVESDSGVYIVQSMNSSIKGSNSADTREVPPYDSHSATVAEVVPMSDMNGHGTSSTAMNGYISAVVEPQLRDVETGSQYSGSLSPGAFVVNGQDIREGQTIEISGTLELDRASVQRDYIVSRPVEQDPPLGGPSDIPPPPPLPPLAGFNY